MSVQFGFQSLRLRNQISQIGFRGQIIGTENLQDFCVLFLVIGGREAGFHMVFPPFQSRFHIPLLKIRVTLRHLERPGNGVCGTAHKILRGLVVRGVKERGYHDNAVHSQKVSI